MIDDEDSLSEHFENKTVNVIDIAVVRFSANFQTLPILTCLNA